MPPIWIVQDREDERIVYLNADDPDDAYQAYITEYPDNTHHEVTVYELPDEVADFQPVNC
jgi:hypothetical protein